MININTFAYMFKAFHNPYHFLVHDFTETVPSDIAQNNNNFSLYCLTFYVI